jgi:hypothetical protein
MLVITGSSLNGLITEIASRAREVRDHNGDMVILPTLTSGQMRAAALTALFIATGEVVWPGDQSLDLKRKPEKGFLNIKE